MLMKMDVLIAGAGPVGLAMAVELARYGVSVRIVDKAAQRTDKSKALVVWSRTLELMDRMGCSRQFLDEGLKVSSANITTGAKRVAHVNFSGVETPYPFGLMIPQSETERLLDDRLKSYGVEVERSVELRQFSQTADGVVSTVSHADGREEELNTSWLIGCDGAHSAVRHQLGMTFLGDTLPTDWMLADVHLAGVRTADEVIAAWHADGVMAIFPMSRDRYRVIADIGNSQGAGQRRDPTLEEVQAVLDHRGPGGIVASAAVWLSTFRINERKVADYRAGRVFVAGDAAHVHSPVGGQGMNTGIQDACNLAWKLALVCRSVCAEEPLLTSYSLERSEVGRQVVAATARATSIALLKGELKQSIRNHLASLLLGLSAVQKVAAEAATEISIAYPHSPLSTTGAHLHGGPAAGERAPIRQGEPPVGAGSMPRFALFAENCDACSRLTEQYPEILEAKVRKPFSDRGLWLVRPDGYVGLVTKKDDWEKANAYLAHLAGTATNTV